MTGAPSDLTGTAVELMTSTPRGLSGGAYDCPTIRSLLWSWGGGDPTRDEWVWLEPYRPKPGGRGRRWCDHRQVINGIPFRVRTGVPLASSAGAVREPEDGLRAASAPVRGWDLGQGPSGRAG